MNISQDEIAFKVFKRVAIDDIGEYSLDDMMLRVLMELDDKKNISTIARNTGLSIPALYPYIGAHNLPILVQQGKAHGHCL